MKKIISFSLWGDSFRYCCGAIRNAQLALIHYPEWECWFYYDNSVPGVYISILNSFSNVKTILVKDGTFGAFWRFRAMQEDTIVLSRDTDSRLSAREKQVVDAWLSTDKKLLTIRDHAGHYGFPILAGMWGIKNGLSEQSQVMMQGYVDNTYYTVDQIYLQEVVWPEYGQDSLVIGLRETPWFADTYESIGKDFIGQAYNESDEGLYEQQKP